MHVWEKNDKPMADRSLSEQKALIADGITTYIDSFKLEHRHEMEITLDSLVICIVKVMDEMAEYPDEADDLLYTVNNSISDRLRVLKGGIDYA